LHLTAAAFRLFRVQRLSSHRGRGTAFFDKRGAVVEGVLSITDLLAAPTGFDGQTVTVVGYYVGEREHHVLHASPDEVKTLSGVWLSHEATVGGNSAVERLKRSWVRVVGVFHNRRRAGASHFNAWPAYISGIKVFEAADPLAQHPA
jgi:hypothetical protein